jgi:hypothetical protein
MVGTGQLALWAEGISLPVKMVGCTKATVGAPRELARPLGEPRRVLREDLLVSRGRNTCPALVVVCSAGVLTTSPLGFPNRATSAMESALC